MSLMAFGRTSKGLSLADKAYRQLTSHPSYSRWGRPHGVFVFFDENDKDAYETIRVYWKTEYAQTTYGVAFMNRHLDIDLGKLSDDVNRHFRLMWRVADELSERLDCKVGWSYELAGYVPRGLR